MPDGPVRTFAEDEAPAAHELENVVARLDDLALEGLAAADEVADAFVGFGGDGDQDESVVAKVARDLDRVAAIGLAMFTRAGGGSARARPGGTRRPTR
jgi:hypothetical protein